jgi:hypothetical protein
MIRATPYSLVSATTRACMLNPASPRTRHIVARRPDSFSRNTESCSTIPYFAPSSRLSTTRFALPSLRWIDFGSTSLTFTLTASTDAIAPVTVR